MKDIINEIESSEGEDANVKNNLDANMRDIDDVNVMDKMHVNESEDENTDDLVMMIQFMILKMK